jgi:hypothetical protein
MPPVFSTSTFFDRSKTETLEHCTLLLLWIIFFATPAELTLKVLVVLVALSRFLAYNAALEARLRAQAQVAWCRAVGQSGCAAVATKIAL